jgi:hypothetical protein
MAFKDVYKDYSGGVTTTVGLDEDTGQIVEHYTGNNIAQLKSNKRHRDNTSDWRKFDPKKELHPVLDLTMVDVMKLKMERGIDVLGENLNYKELFKVIEEHYPYMKTTTARLV